MPATHRMCTSGSYAPHHNTALLALCSVNLTLSFSHLLFCASCKTKTNLRILLCRCINHSKDDELAGTRPKLAYLLNILRIACNVFQNDPCISELFELVDHGLQAASQGTSVIARNPPRGTRAGMEGVAYLPLLPASAVTHCVTATLRQAG